MIASGSQVGDRKLIILSTIAMLSANESRYRFKSQYGLSVTKLSHLALRASAAGIALNGCKIGTSDAGPPIEVTQQTVDDVQIDGPGCGGKLGNGGFIRIGYLVVIKW